MLVSKRFALAACFASAVLAVPVEREKRQNDASFDYIVVGGGTAGLVMAVRLSEDAKLSVAVVEAGTYYQVSGPFLTSTPGGDVTLAGADQTILSSGVDWNFQTTSQAGANGRSVRYPRGKCLGGR